MSLKAPKLPRDEIILLVPCCNWCKLRCYKWMLNYSSKHFVFRRGKVEGEGGFLMSRIIIALLSRLTLVHPRTSVRSGEF